MPSSHGTEVCVLHPPGQAPGDQTHHEVIELRGPGHELGPAHGHADLHESRVLTGLGLPHLTHDPAGRRGQTLWVTAESQTPSLSLWAACLPRPLLCSRISADGSWEEVKDTLTPGRGSCLVFRAQGLRPTGVSWEDLCKVGSLGEGPCVLIQMLGP